MKAAILNIGTELLMGMTVNTNSAYLSEGLSAAGVFVYYHVVVGDNQERIIEAINDYLPKVDVIVTTGGLGPTLDDITKEASAQALGLEMVYHPEVFEGIVERFKKFNRPMTDNNKRQAYFPADALILKNPHGTAPGCIASSGDKTIIMLPGPPRELIPMFDNEVMPWITEKNRTHMKSVFIKLFGIGESSAEAAIMDLIEGQTNPTIASYVKNGEVMLRVTASAGSPDPLDSMLEPTVQAVRERLGDYVYAKENVGLEEVVVNLLREKGLTISLAESCTGGMIAQMLTSVAGSSEVLDRSLVTYSNRAKVELLGVLEETLSSYGAVSRATALEMVDGLEERTGSDVCIAVTGIAGPGGGTEEKPVGTVFISVRLKSAHAKEEFLEAGFESGLGNGIAEGAEGGIEESLVFCKAFRFSGDRERIRLTTAMNALDLVRRLLK